MQLDVLKRPEGHQGKVEASCLAQPAVVGLTHPCPCPDGGESGGNLCGSLLGPSPAEGRSGFSPLAEVGARPEVS